MAFGQTKLSGEKHTGDSNMKMVRSLLLGSAASIVAVAGASAADLPVKAKPVEYVKVCNLYGAGFYYIPGTEICLKMGGYVRYQVFENSGNGYSFGPFYTSGYNSRLNTQSTDLGFRTRVTMTTDTRQQTEYGTLRTFAMLGYQHDSNGSASTTAGGTSPTLYATRGFMQLAGFTFGKSISFYDIYSNPGTSYNGLVSSDSGDIGVMLAAYTAQFGNGLSATISLEDPRRMGVVNSILQSSTGVATPFLMVGSTADNDSNRWPDLVGVLRVDQAWGSAQAMVALHEIGGGYYGTTLTGSMVNGHPDDKLGWAVGGGAIVNTDFISKGDKFWLQVNYTQGAASYMDMASSAKGNQFYFTSGNSLGWGLATDAIFGGVGSSIELTTVWGLNVAYDHMWNRQWKSDVYGGYLNYSYTDTAKSYIAASICGANAYAGAITKMSNCNPDWSYWYIGSRTQFNITPTFYVGLDVMYRRLETGFAGTAIYTAAAGTPRPSGVYKIEDQEAVSVTFRVQRDIQP